MLYDYLNENSKFQLINFYIYSLKFLRQLQVLVHYQVEKEQDHH